MCGIGGVYCLNGRSLSKKDAKRLKALAIEIESRGTDAFGFYNGEKTIKFPGAASDIIEMLENVRPWEEFVVKRKVFLMHTRAYTIGDPLKNYNNHPFELKDIVLAHNGSLYTNIRVYDAKKNMYRYVTKDVYDYVKVDDWKEIFGYEDCVVPDTDSFIIAADIQYYLNQGIDFMNAVLYAVEDLYAEGTFAIWVYNKNTKELALYRDANPLHVAIRGGKIWFASEEKHLEAIGLTGIFQIQPYVVYIIDESGFRYREQVVSYRTDSKKDREYNTVCGRKFSEDECWGCYYYGTCFDLIWRGGAYDSY